MSKRTLVEKLNAAMRFGYPLNANRDYQSLRAALETEPVTLSDERIDYIADLVVKGMPDGIHGFCKSWGWRQFARAILADCAGHVVERDDAISSQEKP